MGVMWDVFLVVVGLAILIKGADYLLNGAVYLSKRFRIPEIVIGLTVVAFGTSLPELVINVLASLRGEAGITVGNVVGSNIANILLILGITALISPIKRHALILRREIPLNLLLVLLLLVLTFMPLGGVSTISRADGLILLLFFSVYLYLTLFRSHGGEIVEGDVGGTLLSSVLQIVGGSVALTLGSNWALDGAVGMANALGLSKVFVGLFVLAVGTSLPELVTSTVAAARGNLYIAIGNVSGSNIFNVAMILGLSALIRPISLPERATFDVLFLLITTLIFLFFTMVSKGNLLGRKRGILFLAIYLFYLALSLHVDGMTSTHPFVAVREIFLNLL